MVFARHLASFKSTQDRGEKEYTLLNIKISICNVFLTTLVLQIMTVKFKYSSMIYLLQKSLMQRSFHVPRKIEMKIQV